jgi:hypothetical protein
MAWWFDEGLERIGPSIGIERDYPLGWANSGVDPVPLCGESRFALAITRIIPALASRFFLFLFWRSGHSMLGLFSQSKSDLRWYATCGAWLVAILAFGFVSGCSGERSLVEVGGSVMVDGKPADGATIMFFPESSSARYVSTGQVGPDGKYSLTTELQPGIPLGKYQVTVIWPDPGQRAEGAKMFQGIAEEGPDLLKGKYALRMDSGLSADIIRGIKEIPRFDLKLP